MANVLDIARSIALTSWKEAFSVWALGILF